MSELSDEDAKILTLARSTRARSGSSAGAAVRDADGRTYTAGGVELAALRLSALQAAVAAAYASGARDLEAAAVVTDADVSADPGLAAVREMSPTAPVFVAGADGVVLTVLRD
ncbi:MAG: cytidine deaminase [Geodermatophilaceae bacterium]|nr:cytidine deaminase [Geodermatophilaceae bacterium]